MFTKAIPVWSKGRETEPNLTLQFKATAPAADKAVVRIATSGIYHLTVGGRFVAYGPARAGKGSFRMDEIDIAALLDRPETTVVIEVCGYNAYSFEVQKQPSFLQAEVVCDGQVVAATGNGFTARVHPFRYRKTPRYSFQRPFTEGYHIDHPDTFLTDDAVGEEPLVPTEPKTILPRRVAYPLYEIQPATPLFSGTVSPCEPAEYRSDRAWENVSDEKLTGFPIDELDIFPPAECQRLRYTPDDLMRGGQLEENSYTVYRLAHITTGMIRWRVTCERPITLYVQFDEILSDGAVDFLRMDCANAIRYDLCAGTHELQTFAIYTLGYLQMVSLGGGCIIEQPEVIEHKHPPVPYTVPTDSEALKKIADAAVETFRQNAVDIFMDCPSRERAGWLCDSFFTARVEKLLTGENLIETNFLENFLHEERYAALPNGMFPMCYPADHMDEVFIPQWAMWLVVELNDYRLRGGDRELIRRFQPRVRKLLGYLSSFENEDGLLEKLDGWNFVEWSMANHLTKDVNYPTNMLYAATLKATADLYDDDVLRDKAEAVLQTVRNQSFDGQFFVDNAVRTDGVLTLSGMRTEVCQYYAFFFGAATPETHPELLRILVEEFGPNRTEEGKWPDIYPANAFIGNYLRLDMLLGLGYRETVKKNIEGYFGYMANTTGTLWENISTVASCNHGFASYVLCWLDQLK
ncbi:MAG: hypothetical protein IK954_03365 [Clostridia bacterium]|nr:hypothetical protein [Clostridia bacterium]